MREIKFRIWNCHGQVMHQWHELVEKNKIHLLDGQQSMYKAMQYTGVKDKNDVEIYEDDIVRFADKYEWYRSPFRSEDEIKDILEDHVKYPYKQKLVKIPESYKWLLSGEIQTYWEVVGNIHQNPELKELK